MTTELRVPGYRGVFAGGDVAATDPLRSSARNRADVILAHNVCAERAGRVCAERAGRQLRRYQPPRRRWGSVIGAQADGLEVFAPSGHPIRIPALPVDRLVMPLIIRRGTYRGVRTNRPLE